MAAASIRATLASIDGATWTFRGQASAAAADGDVAAQMRDLLAQTAAVREESNTALTALVAAERAAGAAPEKRRRTDTGEEDEEDEAEEADDQDDV